MSFIEIYRAWVSTYRRGVCREIVYNVRDDELEDHAQNHTNQEIREICQNELDRRRAK